MKRVNGTHGDGGALKRITSAIAGIARQRFTIMLIPHSERRVVNLQINAVAAVFFVVMFFVVLGSFFFVATVFTGSSRLVTEKSDALRTTEASLDSVLDEVSHVIQLSRTFESTLHSTLAGLNLQTGDRLARDVSATGDLSEFLDLQEVDADTVREVYELQRLAGVLRDSVDPLTGIKDILETQRRFLSDIPNAWPLMGGRGIVMMEWGPNIHPFTGQWYMHDGIDIADMTGAPVAASANGKVSEIGSDPLGYGNYIWIRHKYGFRTRYAHLNTVEVTEGEDVFQGQRIGTVGDTGMATGPHLHFELWLGTDVLDPAHFLKVQNTFNRRLPNQRVVNPVR